MSTNLAPSNTSSNTVTTVPPSTVVQITPTPAATQPLLIVHIVARNDISALMKFVVKHVGRLVHHIKDTKLGQYGDIKFHEANKEQMQEIINTLGKTYFPVYGVDDNENFTTINTATTENFIFIGLVAFAGQEPKIITDLPEF